MTVLIVDDEQAVKEGMSILLDWEKQGISQVLYASNGREALEILENQKPDIMFCDMQMPIMDGRELLEEVEKKKLNTKVIAVSGYNDFEYVKATLQVNGIDYILKPIDESELLAALEKAIALCKKESKDIKRKHQYQKMSEEVSIQSLREWLEGKRKFDNHVSTALESLEMYGEEVFVSLIVFQNPLVVKEELFQGDGVLMRFSLINIIQELFGESACQLIDIDEFLYILLVDGKRVNMYKMILERFLSMTKEMFQLQFFFEFDSETVQIQKVFSQMELLKYRLLSRKLTKPSSSMKESKERIGSVKGVEALLHLAIRDKNIEGIQSIVADLCAGFKREANLTFRELQFQSVEMNLLLGRLAHDNATIQDVAMEPVSVWIFHLDIWQEVVKNRIYKVMKYQPDNLFNIESVQRFLQEYYARDISINMLTECFHQSPQHISKKFKEKYDMTIVTCLRKIRMEHAKKYLQTGSMSIIEIAKAIGYDDENYFSKVFKKERGISPKKYRDKVQKEAGK